MEQRSTKRSNRHTLWQRGVFSFLVSDAHHAFRLLFNLGRYAIEENEAAREAALAIRLSKFKVLDDHLHGKRYMPGDRKSILDAYVFPMIRWIF